MLTRRQMEKLRQIIRQIDLDREKISVVRLCGKEGVGGTQRKSGRIS